MRVPPLLRGLFGDARLACRRLLAAPMFTIFAVLSVAVGVAITTSVYSIVDRLFLRELGVRDPDRVAIVVVPDQGRVISGSISEPDFRDLRAAQKSFTRISAAARLHPALTTPLGTVRVTAEAIDGAYFTTLGINATLGRLIQPADDDQRERVAVLGHTLWRTRFDADSAVIGQTVRVAGEPFVVIGVSPETFRGTNGWFGGTELWIPLSVEPEPAKPPPATSLREMRRFAVLGRLAPAATLAGASAELAAIGGDLDARYPSPALTRSGQSERRWMARSVAALDRADNPTRRFGLALVALVSLVLVVACTNLANLVLSRGVARQKELAVRRALGAPRWRLVREQCMESVTLAGLGAVAAFAMFQGLRVLLDTDINLSFPPGGRLTLEIRPMLSAEAVGVAAGSLLLSLIVFGLEPAVQLTRSADVRGALAQSAGTGNPRGARQRMLLRMQITAAAGFFIIATMFVKYTVAEARHDPGVDLNPLGVAFLSFDRSLGDETRSRRITDELVDDLQRNPAVASASASVGLPFGAPSRIRLMLTPADQASVQANAQAAAIVIAATPSLFRTIGVPILRGRGFDDRDHAAAPPVVVLSEFAARRYFGAADAVGRTMVVQQGRARSSMTVIGVARDTDVGAILADARPLAYVPLAQRDETQIALVARGSAGAAGAVQALRESLRRVEPDLPVEVIGTGRQMLAGPFELVMGLGASALALGGITLVLAMVGLFGIQSHIVTNRTREIGVRMSMGASARQIERMVLRDGYGPVIDGLAYGLIVGLGGRAIVRSYMDIDVAIVDPWMLVATPIPLILAAFFACHLPARRAASVDPNVALRQE